MSNVILHFSIGPVKDFVAQARRTRDFWAGSFLLSYLSALAMLEILENGGEIVYPIVATNGKILDPLLKAIKDVKETKTTQENPSIATLPNRFMARVPMDFDAKRCVEAVKNGWNKIAQSLWQRYVMPVASKGKGTDVIWKRQVESFWEINWAMGGEGQTNLLELRKNWRTHLLPDEPGDKCTLMGLFQEISGYTRTRERNKQEEFWKALRERVGEYQLDEKERLSAIGLIKRLFPLVAKDAIGWDPKQRNYPSTPYLAALPWIVEVITDHKQAALEYAQLFSNLPEVNNTENYEIFPELKEIATQNPDLSKFLSLSGNCFHKSALENPNLWNIQDVERQKEFKKKTKEALENIERKVGQKPSPFYALLLFDGDNMGKLLRECNPQEVSLALKNFSAKVDNVVSKYRGVLVYAGGDDVLALSSLENALDLAIDIRKTYTHSFEEVFKQNFADVSKSGGGTISGAIVYAHYNLPFTAIVRQAHHLLDDVAKDKTGRDSLAITVWKGSGQTLVWSAPWDFLITENGNIFKELMGMLNPKGDDRQFSFSFFYNLKTLVESLFSGDKEKRPKLSHEDLLDLLAAEYRKSKRFEVDWTTAKKNVENIVKICRKVKRESSSKKGGYLTKVDEDSFVTDGLMLIKFLTQRGLGA